MTSPTIVSVLERRRNKAIAIVLGFKEREVDKLIPNLLADKLRKVVLDQFNEYHEMVMDVIRSLDTGAVTLNQEFLDKLDEIHTTVKQLNGD